MERKVLALIPARGGSKRVPRKNVRDLGGKPLIAHTIDQAERADAIDIHAVSTDDDETERIARAHEGNVPFERPASLATDEASTSGVVSHALDWYAERDRQFDIVCLLQVTSPLRTPTDIDGALARLQRTGAESVVTVSPYRVPPQWAVTEGEDGYLTEAFDTGTLWTDDATRSQDLPELSHPNGAVFASTVEAWRMHETFYAPRTVGYEMPPGRGLDIDEPWELEVARALYAAGD